jgi:hypothetical protein
MCGYSHVSMSPGSVRRPVVTSANANDCLGGNDHLHRDGGATRDTSFAIKLVRPLPTCRARLSESAENLTR